MMSQDKKRSFSCFVMPIRKMRKADRLPASDSRDTRRDVWAGINAKCCVLCELENNHDESRWKKILKLFRYAHKKDEKCGSTCQMVSSHPASRAVGFYEPPAHHD